MSPIGIARATLAAAAAAVSSTAPAPESSASPAVNASGTAFPELAHFFGNNTQWANHMAQDDPDFFPSTNKSQHPGIVWLGCSDSRVPESVITQQHPGSIFTHVSELRSSSEARARASRGARASVVHLLDIACTH